MRLGSDEKKEVKKTVLRRVESRNIRNKRYGMSQWWQKIVLGSGSLNIFGSTGSGTLVKNKKRLKMLHKKLSVQT